VIGALRYPYLPPMNCLLPNYTHRSVPLGGKIVIGPGYLILAVMASMDVWHVRARRGHGRLSIRMHWRVPARRDQWHLADMLAWRRACHTVDT